MRYRFVTCDVFTENRFGGNPLAVLPDARGLSDAQMQQIAREFNYSETTFVLPPEGDHTKKVRIFTPASEVPFAGHPNVGTAFVLANAGEFGELGASTLVSFEEQAGVVAMQIDAVGGRVRCCELAAPEQLTLGPSLSGERIAAALSMDPTGIVSETHPPQVASVGLPILFAELRDRDTLGRVQVDPAAIETLRREGAPSMVHLYIRSADDFDLRARMFAPLDGVPEDPATGSANCALAALLCHCAPQRDVELRLHIAQGVEMGRPSVLNARAEKRDGHVTGAWIGGACVPVAEGTIEID